MPRRIARAASAIIDPGYGTCVLSCRRVRVLPVMINCVADGTDADRMHLFAIASHSSRLIRSFDFDRHHAHRGPAAQTRVRAVGGYRPALRATLRHAPRGRSVFLSQLRTTAASSPSAMSTRVRQVPLRRLTGSPRSLVVQRRSTVRAIVS